MIVLSNSADQTLAPGEAIIFDRVVAECGEKGCHCRSRRGSSLKLTKNATYTISFKGNIGDATGTGFARLSLETGGDEMPETRMVVPTDTAGNLTNVAVTIPYCNCCPDYSRVSVVNTGTTTITVAANSMLAVRV